MANNTMQINNQIEFITVEDDSNILKLANKLLKGQILCLNLIDCPIEQGEKIINFLSGVNYATDGLVKTLQANIFLFGLKEHFKEPSIKNFIKEYSIKL